MRTSSSKQEDIARKIAGELVLSTRPDLTLTKWREIFDITKAQMVRCMQVSPSVLSDYESGRRTPGTRFIKKFVEGAMKIDRERGGQVIRELSYITFNIADVVLGMQEFHTPVKANKLCQVVNGVPIACIEQLNQDLYGYTIIDSVKAIQNLSGTDFYQFFGSTTERAAIFINVTSGRSPMVAVRVHPLKPKMVIIQGPKKIDSLAVRIAEVEHIPLVLSKIDSSEELVRVLERFYREFEVVDETSRNI